MSALARPPVADAAARRAALTELHRTLLVEAGAGSGKTSLMAGRVVALLAAGAAPHQIAAITFTTLAAADLSARIRGYLDRLLADELPPELSLAFPDGLDQLGRAHLERARAQLDDLTSTTIHGFCQDLLRPYPVEADVDPGARVIDETEAELLFEDVRHAWMRARFGPEAAADGAIARMAAVDVDTTLALVGTVIELMRSNRGARPPAVPDLHGAYQAFERAAQAVEAAAGADAPPESVPFAQGAAELRRHLRPHALDRAALALAAVQLPVTHLHVKTGYRSYRTETAWKRSDRHGGSARFQAAKAALAELAQAEAALVEAASCFALAALIEELTGLQDDFAAAKRQAALLDFDDLLVQAERLLRHHGEVRATLAQRYRHVLVDEFQDTDPLQARIVWLLCSDEEPVATPWPRLRPGALFVVGDPKQSIYRFRGADVGAYLAARDAVAASDGGAVLRVTTNFRSLDGILDFANRRFGGPLSGPGQPGFEPLSAARRAEAGVGCVYRLTVRADPALQPDAATRRDLEAEAVADAVAGLLDTHPLPSRGGAPCRPADVALLAPAGSDLWRFERALEDRGIAVSTLAGKGFYGRQEVQDLIALTRVLADERDTLALGALLRGPLVGCTDEVLLDVAERMHAAGRGDALSLATPLDVVGDETVRTMLADLRDLHARARRTTPSHVLQEAVARLRVRAVLVARHPRHADRALANVERYLELATGFDVRGLGAFARTMRERWRDAEKAVEGRPDEVDDAVTLITVHSSKGLEWPVVLPVNTFGPPRRQDPQVLDRRDGSLHARVLGRRYPALDGALEHEAAAEAQERLRLWYVAATRAQDLLVLPTPGFEPHASWWCRMVDLRTDELPELPLEREGPGPRRDAPAPAPDGDEVPTRERFELERRRLAATRPLRWVQPSRLPSDEEPPLEPPRPRGEGAEDRVDADPWPVPAPLARGRVLHALLHEVLAGVLSEDAHELRARAAELVARTGAEPDLPGLEGLAPERLAGDVRRALAVPQVAAHRDRLVGEVPVYALEALADVDEATAGVADAVAFDASGRALLVVDWKSDVDPPAERIGRYEAQLRRYVELLGAPSGLLVFVASGDVREVPPR